MTEISNTDKTISVSDITERVDELREERADHDAVSYVARNDDGTLSTPYVDEAGNPNADTWEGGNPDKAEELANLEKLLESIEGHGNEWRWEWKRYPESLIAEHYFEEYAQEMAHDVGAVSRDASWIVIDWTATANGLKQDYREVDFDGSTYWHRV
jgi:hypothetical protein